MSVPVIWLNILESNKKLLFLKINSIDSRINLVNNLVNKENVRSKLYKEVRIDSDKKVYKHLLLLVEKYCQIEHKKSNWTSKETKYLTDFKWQSCNICCTPKIYKCKSIQEAIVLANDNYIKSYQPDDLKGRSIISGPESPTQRLSCIIETLLKPIVSHLITYIKDDWEFIKSLPIFLTFDSDMYSCDIEILQYCYLEYNFNTYRTWSRGNRILDYEETRSYFTTFY